MLFVLDLGGTQVKSGLVDAELNLLEKFPSVNSPQTLEGLVELIDHLIQPYLSQIDGVAISAPGTVDTDKDTIYFGGLLAYLDQFDVGAFFQERYGLTAHVINDGKAAVLAEFVKGSLQGVRNGLALVLGSGLGGGLILNGQLYQGSHFQAGELTFVLTQAAQSGELGLLGVQLSAVNLIEQLAGLLGLEDTHDGPTVFSYLAQKDQRLYPSFEAYCRQVALSILNLQTTLDVERVAIGGGISNQPILLEEINRQFDQLKASIPPVQAIIKRPEIVACNQGNAANLLGAACHFYQVEPSQS